jgi:phosphatidylserine decarboxylase
MVGVTIWVCAFFRDPIRSVPQGKELIVAPADGLITMIQKVAAAARTGGRGRPGPTR